MMLQSETLSVNIKTEFFNKYFIVFMLAVQFCSERALITSGAGIETTKLHRPFGVDLNKFVANLKIKDQGKNANSSFNGLESGFQKRTISGNMLEFAKEDVDDDFDYDFLNSFKRSGKQFSKIWDQWGQWSKCSVTCGVGKFTRWRHCVGGSCALGEKEAQLKTCTLATC